ncbi:MAG: nucleotidyltransferase domain-containing protein [Candidatus Woesearchaeota archaeon]|nr:nucleotidyltransferase domain-containing protein [Candidatus Woesearchaeota archaeon]
MLTSKQTKIFGAFTGNAFKEYSYKDLKEYSKKKSNSVLQDAVKKFVEEKFVTERKIGKNRLFSLNHRNEKVYSYLEIFANERLDNVVKRSIDTLKQEIDKYTSFYSLVVFGSYADKTNKKSSDVDIAVIIPDKTQQKNIEVAIKSAELKSLSKMDIHIITFDEFLEMLKVDYENLGKEIARKNLPLYNSAIFYKTIQRGIQNGFKTIP